MKTTTEDQFLFFCSNIGNEILLKEEIKIFYPDFYLSYSRKGFLTYKNKGICYDLDTISQLELTFATRSGICLGKTSKASLLNDLKLQVDNFDQDYNKIIFHSFNINLDAEDEACLDMAYLLDREINSYSPINKNVIDIINLGRDEIWFGIHKVGKLTTHYPNSKIEISIPADIPSRSYIKLAEAVDLFNINITKADGVLDFGSSPGGSTYYLLEKGCKVWGIDPAKMNSQILNNDNYTHIMKSIQDLSQEELPYRDIHWIHADLNLNPKQAIKEVLRLAKKYSSRLKGIIFTVQIVKNSYVACIEEFEDQFFDWGFTSVISRQVPSHKKEYVIIAKR